MFQLRSPSTVRAENAQQSLPHFRNSTWSPKRKAKFRLISLSHAIDTVDNILSYLTRTAFWFHDWLPPVKKMFGSITTKLLHDRKLPLILHLKQTNKIHRVTTWKKRCLSFVAGCISEEKFSRIRETKKPYTNFLLNFTGCDCWSLSFTVGKRQEGIAAALTSLQSSLTPIFSALSLFSPLLPVV